MSSAALGTGHDALLPRAPGGTGPGAALALLVHAGLVAALTVSVDWRTRTPDVVSAELWASVPQVAAPAPVPPPPPAPEPAPAPAPAPAPPPPQAAPQPAEPDIALERAERRRAEERRKAELAAERAKEAVKERERLQAAEAERQRVAAEKRRADEEKKQREKAAAEAREAKAAEERLARQREENLRRMMAQAGGSAGTGPATSTGTAAQNAAPSAAYSGRLVALIRGNLVFTGSTPDNNAAEVEVSASASGAIISRRLVKSSGHKEWDDAVLRAIDRTATLPRDVDGRVPQRLIINFRPRE